MLGRLVRQVGEPVVHRRACLVRRSAGRERTAAALPGRAANRSAAGTRRRRSRASPSARRIVTGPVRNPARASSEGPCPGPSRTCVPSGHLQPCLPILRITAVHGWRVQRGFLPFPNGPWCDPRGRDRHGRGDRGRVCEWARSTRPNCSRCGSTDASSTPAPGGAHHSRGQEPRSVRPKIQGAAGLLLTVVNEAGPSPVCLRPVVGLACLAWHRTGGGTSSRSAAACWRRRARCPYT
jgi:hypothetical protein